MPSPDRDRVEAAAKAIRNIVAEIEVQSRGETTPDPMWFSERFAKAAVEAADKAALAGAEGVGRELTDLINEQAEEPGIWFVAERVTEAYLQQELRKLHEKAEQAAATIQAQGRRIEELEREKEQEFANGIEAALGEHEKWEEWQEALLRQADLVDNFDRDGLLALMADPSGKYEVVGWLQRFSRCAKEFRQPPPMPAPSRTQREGWGDASLSTPSPSFDFYSTEPRRRAQMTVNPEDISPSQFGGAIGVTLGDQRRPWRHMHHDYQAIDEVRMVTVPRYKTSGLSGDEWRISGKIQYLKKGVVVYERSCRNIESALRYGDWWLTEWLENGNYSAGRADHQCDQEGCNETATVTYRLKKLYDRSSGNPREPIGPTITRFCDRHKTRGDCGLEDADNNYELVTLNDDGSIGTAVQNAKPVPKPKA